LCFLKWAFVIHKALSVFPEIENVVILVFEIVYPIL